MVALTSPCQPQSGYIVGLLPKSPSIKNFPSGVLEQMWKLCCKNMDMKKRPNKQ